MIVFVVCGNATLEEGKGRSVFLKMENVTYHVHRAVTRGVSGFFFPRRRGDGCAERIWRRHLPRALTQVLTALHPLLVCPSTIHLK